RARPGSRSRRQQLTDSPTRSNQTLLWRRQGLMKGDGSAMSNVLYGLDTSKGQGQYDYAGAQANGAAFAGIQLTYGVGTDPWGKTNVGRAQDAGLLVMAYHFAQAGDGAPQADHFRDCLAELPGQVMPVFDIEPKQGCSKTVVLDFLDRWEANGAARLAVYSG